MVWSSRSVITDLASNPLVVPWVTRGLDVFSAVQAILASVMLAGLAIFERMSVDPEWKRVASWSAVASQAGKVGEAAVDRGGATAGESSALKGS
jgi:hypothetical protein